MGFFYSVFYWILNTLFRYFYRVEIFITYCTLCKPYKGECKGIATGQYHYPFA